MPLVSRARATFRSAEFGFFGVCVKTRTHTPRFCGLFCSAGLFVLLTIFLRPARTNWLIVGILPISLTRHWTRLRQVNRDTDPTQAIKMTKFTAQSAASLSLQA